ncbi:MAG: hypothetical protein V4640_08250 [Verrucomicrobiota bacterium]
MTTRTTLLLVLAVGSLAFLLGSRSEPSAPATHPLASNKLRARNRPDIAVAHEPAREREKPAFTTVTRDEAERLSPQQRLEWLSKAARLTDINQQADILCGLIAAMSRDELPAATQQLIAAQRAGNDSAHRVWADLWQRWGQVAPEDALKSTPGNPGPQTSNDWRNFMKGWLAADPAAAMAWAQARNPGEGHAAAVAVAITGSSSGNLKQLEKDMVKLSPDAVTTRECLHDYYDLAIVSGGKADAAEVYDNLAPELKEAAWPVTLERLGYTAPREAAQWVEDHAKDPGVDYETTQRLVYRLGNEDPAWTMDWLSRVEVDNRANGEIKGPPLSWIALSIWKGKDAAAANAWEAAQEAKFAPKNAPATPER